MDKIFTHIIINNTIDIVYLIYKMILPQSLLKAWKLERR